jgi:WD40 repeat protein
VVSAAFDPNGTWFATAELGTAARVWDAASGRTIGGSLPNAADQRPVFVPGSRRRLVTADASTTWLWNLDETTWPDVACAAAGRNFTRAEWLQLGPRGEPYRVTCPRWPAR